MTQLIDGKKESQLVLAALKTKIEILQAQGKRLPSLAVILVGDNAASEIYVRHKEQACAKVGITSKTYKLPVQCPQQELWTLINTLNTDTNVDGILLQLPLPTHIPVLDTINLIAPNKDVDGLTAVNQGLLVQNRANFIPCTPLGILMLLQSIHYSLAGKLVAVVGRSLLVGAPLAKLFMHQDATVIHLHSKSLNPQKLTKQADLLVVAAGVANLVDATWIKEGSVVVDVGMHRENEKLCGDVNFEQVKDKTSFITPVPGGVGPMTIAALLSNCLKAYTYTT
jgi:methylenetetrahydrofolate dehydrogenase (NADP+)/methenyltetrahydrofolate cyclohydrolase